MGPPPTGPPPTGPGQAGPSWPQRRIRPGAGWYALPAVLVLVAMVGFFTLLAFLWDDAEVADGPPAAGDPVSGVTVQFSEGYSYFIYVRTGESSPYKCTVKAGDQSRRVRLTRKNSWSASEHASYRYTATFQAPLSGDGRLTCKGTDGPILVTPDDTVHGYLGLAMMAALAIGGLAVLAFVITLVRRNDSRQKAVTAAGPYG
jgi:hypothetical protein